MCRSTKYRLQHDANNQQLEITLNDRKARRISMRSNHNLVFRGLFIASCLVFMTVNTLGYDLERNKNYTQNKFLQLKPNGESIKELENEIKPNIDLKGGSTQEEKELLSAFYLLGYTTNLIVYNYSTYPLGSKIGDSTLKSNLISSLKNLRDMMSQVEANDNLLELINKISDDIEKENINSNKANPKIEALLNELSGRIYDHIKNTFGQSYGLYYSFGTWTNKVITYCEATIVIDSLGEKDISKSEKIDVLTSLTKELKELLELSATFKTQTENLTVKAVSRNLDSIQEIASEIKTSIDAKTAKRLYDYSLNIYFGIVPQ